MSAHILARLSEAFSRRAHQLATHPRRLAPQLYADLVAEWGAEACAPILQRIERHLDGRRWLRLARQPPVRTSRSALVRTMDNGAAILSVAWAPETNRLATSGADGRIRLWDPDSGARLQSLEEGRARPMTLAWTPDGERLIAGYSDASLRVWGPSAASPLRFQPKGKLPAAQAVACSPDERYFAVASARKTARIYEPDASVISLWDLMTGSCAAEWQVTGTISSLAWSPDGHALAGAGGSVVRLWEVPSGAPGPRISWGGQYVRQISWSPDGTRIASIGTRAVVKLSDPRSGKTLRELKGHQESVKAIAWSWDGTRLASLGEERTLAIWACERWERIGETTVEGYGALAWSADGSRLAISLENNLQIYTSALATPARRKTALLPIRSLEFSPDGKSLAGGGNGGWLHVWSSATGKASASRQVDPWGIDHIAWAPDGSRRLAVSGLSGLHIWNPHNDELRTLVAWKGGSVDLEWSEDGELLVLGLMSGLRIYRVATGTAERDLALGTPVSGFAWRPGAQLLAIGLTATRRISTPTSERNVTSIERVSLVRAAGGEPLAEFAIPGLGLEWFDWMPGGSHLAVFTGDNALHLWNPEAPSAARRVQLKRALPQPLAWAPDGSLMALGRGPFLRIREVSSGRLVRSIECQDEVAAARFEKNGKLLAVADFGRASGHQPIPYLFELR